MIDTVKRFFEKFIKQPVDADERASGHALRLATAVLLVEIMKADFEVRDEERDMVRKAIRTKFDLTPEESGEMLRLAEEEARKASSYHEFTALINREFTLDRKIKIVEHLWEVAFADPELEKHEEHLIRKISGLLYVPHKDFISAKIRARERVRG